MLVPWIAAVALATEPAPVASIAPAPSADPAIVRLIYTGGSGGIGSGRYRFELVDALTDRLEGSGRAVDALAAHHGALAHDDWLVVADDRRVATLVAFTHGGAVTCDAPRPALVIRTTTEVLIVDPAEAPSLAELVADEASAAEVRACRNEAAEVRLAGPAGAGLPDDWSRFELRLAVRLGLEGGDVADVVGLPDDEATRRASVLLDLRRAYPDALVVDAGSFVDGTSSVRDNALSLHRPIGFDVLRRLDPAALVPGRTELAGGAAHLLDEAGDLPWVATNWRADDEERALPRSRVVTVGDRRVAFLGAIDPAVAHGVPRLVAEGITLAEPVSAVQTEVDALRSSAAPPDLVVLLTELEGPLLGALQRHLDGVDLVVGDTGPDTERIARIEATVRPARASAPPPAFTLPLDGIGFAELALGAHGLAKVRLEPRRVTPDLDPDPEVLARVQAVRATEYPPLDRPLLPAPPDAPTEPLSRTAWEKVVCEAVLAYSGADVALLAELPQDAAVPGALTELLVVDRLATRDVLEVHEVLGAALPRLLDKAHAVVPVACGAPLGVKAPKIAGRPVEPDRLYRVVTTDRTRADPAVATLVAEGRPSRLLDRPSRRTLAADGAPVTLRRAVLTELRALRDAGDDVLASLVERSPDQVPPRWVLRARPISFSVERFDGADDPRFAEIPETLATSPSSLTLSTHDDVQLEYSSKGLIWDARARAGYTRLVTEGEHTESADDLKLSTSASLPGAAIPFGGVLRPMPFAEALYDSEFTPIVGEDGRALPLQRDLSLTLGLSGRAGIFQTLRLGAFALQDLSVVDKPVEYGARTEVHAKVGFGPGLFWSNQLDAYLWADTPGADASDLRFRALLDSRVELPLAWWLGLAVYGRGFAFQGRVPETDHLGASWTIGAALDFTGAFAL